jgi:hypothetical protein
MLQSPFIATKKPATMPRAFCEMENVRVLSRGVATVTVLPAVRLSVLAGAAMHTCAINVCKPRVDRAEAPGTERRFRNAAIQLRLRKVSGSRQIAT